MHVTYVPSRDTLFLNRKFLQVANHQEGEWRPQDVNQLIGKICKKDILEEEVILKIYIEF